MTIRPATSADDDRIAQICLLTGHRGEDATGVYGDDALLADVYATPYLRHESGFCLVWEHAAEVLGYVLGTSDTRAFQRWFSTEWGPRVIAPRIAVADADGTLLAMAARADRMIIPQSDAYPAHLHIDLLERARGQGAGRLLIAAGTQLLAERGAPGVHLIAETANVGAQSFYPRVGFTAIARDESTVTWAAPLARRRRVTRERLGFPPTR